MNPYLFLWHCPFKHLYKSFKKWPLTPRSIEWLCAISYCAELDLAQYHTAQNLTPCGMILCRVNLEKLEFLGENETKFDNISTHYSVAKADSNYEKTVRKSRLTVPLRLTTGAHCSVFRNMSVLETCTFRSANRSDLYRWFDLKFCKWFTFLLKLLCFSLLKIWAVFQSETCMFNKFQRTPIMCSV